MKKSKIVLLITLITALVMVFSTSSISFADISGENVVREDFEEEVLENVLLPKDTFIEDQNEGVMVQPQCIGFNYNCGIF